VIVFLNNGENIFELKKLFGAKSFCQLAISSINKNQCNDGKRVVTGSWLAKWQIDTMTV
jgi:hypothetical protein